MIKHVVMWKFKPEIDEGQKQKLKDDMAENLEGLVGIVPGLIKADFIKEPVDSSTHDMALISVHETKEALAAYSSYPDHVKVADTYIRPFVHERCCLDYEE